MRSFFKIFFASLAALIVFVVLLFFFLTGMISRLATRDNVELGAKAVLVVDLRQSYPELTQPSPLSGLREEYEAPALYDVVRLIAHAKSDSSVKAIYLKCGSNVNGFATSEEIRNALLGFRKSGKPVFAYADVITQGGYRVANAADRIYCNPKGGVDWRGFAMELTFLKGTLDKLNIEPQIFYAGKFKSATEPFRAYKMTDPNRIQTTEILDDLYGHFLGEASEARKQDTARLHDYANAHQVQFASDALRLGLVDGLKYDDEVKEELRRRINTDRIDDINFVPLGKYAKVVDYKQSGSSKISVIYAQGDIIDGRGDRTVIGSETYRSLIRKARLDNSIKAIVVRVNSGGGSSLASENIWREMTLARQSKPVVVSFGDVAASGAYYMSCNADSIFAQPNTITGSIGVFSIIPNFEKFFNDKLGVTFDRVKTAPDADIMSVTKPLTDMQKRYIQNEVDSIYLDFKTRVAQGRKKDINYIDSIAQGRIWSGNRALQLGLVDRIGGLQDAIDCAARMAKVTDYKLREYPEPQSLLQRLLGGYQQNETSTAIREELGEDGVKMYSTMKKIKRMVGSSQARLPFEFTIQ